MSKLTEIYTEKKSDISLYANYSKYISVKLIYLKNEYSALVIYSSNIKKATLNYLEFLSEALLISKLMIFFELSADSRLGKHDLILQSLAVLSVGLALMKSIYLALSI